MPAFDILIYAALVLLIASSIKGFTGLGLPAVAMVLLTLKLDPRSAVSLILMPMLMSNIWQMIRGAHLGLILRRYWRFALILATCVVTTVWISRDVNDAILKGVLGVFAIVFALVGWRNMVPEIPARHERLVEISTAGLAGIVGGLAALWAPFLVVYLSAKRVPPGEFVQALGFLITAGSLPLLISYASIGHASGAEFLASTLLLVPTLIGYSLGEHLRQRSDPEVFRKALLIVFAALGAILIWRSVMIG